MLAVLKNNKLIKILSTIMLVLIVIIVGVPIFEILIEIISNAGRIVGTFIRLNS